MCAVGCELLILRVYDREHRYMYVNDGGKSHQNEL